MNTQIRRYVRYFVKVGHSGVFKVNNYVITVDTSKYVLKGATCCFDLINRSS